MWLKMLKFCAPLLKTATGLNVKGLKNLQIGGNSS